MAESDDKDEQEAPPDQGGVSASASKIKPPLRGREPSPDDKGSQRGLSAIREARETRKKRKLPSLKVAGWFLVVVAAVTVVYWYRSSADLEQERSKLMADQRAVAATLGKSWDPLRDEIDALAVAAAKGPTDDLVEKDDLAKFSFQKKPGIYLRLRLDEAADADAIKKGAETSLHDAFTSCLMETAGDDPLAGPECKTAHDCAEGQLCNELDHCSNPTQPFNLRMAYKTMYVLTPEWVKDVQDASDEKRLRALRVVFDDAIKSDIPLAVKLVTQAQFLMLVLDERPAPPANEPADAGVTAEDQDALDGKHYASRVFVYRLSDQKLLLRLRRDPKPELLGAVPASDPHVEAARLRQVRSCGLAMEVKSLLGPPSAPTAPKEPAPAPSGSASAMPSASAAPSAAPASSGAPKPGSSAAPKH